MQIVHAQTLLLCIYHSQFCVSVCMLWTVYIYHADYAYQELMCAYTNSFVARIHTNSVVFLYGKDSTVGMADQAVLQYWLKHLILCNISIQSGSSSGKYNSEQVCIKTIIRVNTRLGLLYPLCRQYRSVASSGNGFYTVT